MGHSARARILPESAISRPYEIPEKNKDEQACRHRSFAGCGRAWSAGISRTRYRALSAGPALGRRGKTRDRRAARSPACTTRRAASSHCSCRTPDGRRIVCSLPLELVATVAQRLGKYVLRAKVRITDESQPARRRFSGWHRACRRHRARLVRTTRVAPSPARLADCRSKNPSAGRAPTSKPACRRCTRQPARPSSRRC